MNNLSSSPSKKEPINSSPNLDSPDSTSLIPEADQGKKDLEVSPTTDTENSTIGDKSSSISQTTDASGSKSPRRNLLRWWRNKTNASNQSSDITTLKETVSHSDSSLPTSQSTSAQIINMSGPITEVRLFAPLDTVGTENYLRYGVEGPRHYVMGLIESVVTPEDINIQLEIVALDATVKFDMMNIQLKRLAHEPQHQTVWGSYNADIHAQIIWIWDFFRMLSSIQLQVQVPSKPDVNNKWSTLADTLQNLATDDKLIIRVQNNVGTITQIHRVTSNSV